MLLESSRLSTLQRAEDAASMRLWQRVKVQGRRGSKKSDVKEVVRQLLSQSTPQGRQQQLLGGWKVLWEVVGQQVVIGVAVEGAVVGQAVPLATQDPCVALSYNALHGKTRSESMPKAAKADVGPQ